MGAGAPQTGSARAASHQGPWRGPWPPRCHGARSRVPGGLGRPSLSSSTHGRIDPARVGTDLGRDGGLLADVSLDGVSVGGRSLSGFTLDSHASPAGARTRRVPSRSGRTQRTLWFGGGLGTAASRCQTPSSPRPRWPSSSSRSPRSPPRHLRPLPRPMAMDRERHEGQAPTGRAHDAANASAPLASQAPPGEEGAGGDEGIPLEDLIAEVMF